MHKFLTEIFRDQSLNPHGKTDYRSAVRAVVFHGQNLLMVFSSVNGDYKFPGGGVEENEAPEAALRREISEECGMRLTRILEEIGSIIEYAYPLKSEFDVFKMTSSYYLCEVDGTINGQKLDDYEEELGFRPVWVDIDAAIQTNKTVLAVQTKWPPAWTAREVFMLEYVKEHFLNSTQLTASPTVGTPPPAPRAPDR
jgi:8-oxo-dGTP pyrophosphatase MutT (NUDIX family)